MPEGRIIALKGEVGVQARTFGPGMHPVFPFLYKSDKANFIFIGNNEIGLVEAITGDPIPPGRVFARMVQCNLFQDGEAFLTNGGQKGPQIQILTPGNYRINTRLFNITKRNIMVIQEEEIGLVESIDGDPVPSGKIFAKVVDCDLFQNVEAFLNNGGQRGPQIQILPPGNYRINTALFTVKPQKATVINKGQIGIVTAMDGMPMVSGRLLSRETSGHSNFEDGEAFLKNGGEKGPQSQILLPGTYRINTDLFKVDVRDAIVIPAKKVGLVTARDGQPLPENEYVAKPIQGHNNFQDVTAFLKNGGQRGPQLDVLKPGTYYINPLMFDVELDDVTVVERGEVAVIISNVGDEPSQVKEAVDSKSKLIGETSEPQETIDDDKHLEIISSIDKRLDAGIERYVVPKGFRGIQDEVAGPGVYYLNKRAFITHIVNTTNITIDWDESTTTRFDPLKVISHDGFEISVSVKVVIRVRPDQAPYMVAKIGSVENLVDHVIHPMIDSSFRNQASSTSAMNFMQNRHEEQEKAEDRTRLELERYHVELVSVLICQIMLPPELMKTQTEKIIAQQQQAMYEEQQKAQQSRISTEKTRAEADRQGDLVQSEIDVKIADNKKARVIKEAEGEGESIRLKKLGESQGIETVGRAEAIAIQAKGEATAAAYEKQKLAVSAEGLVAIEISRVISSGNVKVTPDFLVQGDGNIGGLLSSYLLKQVTSGLKD
jgi:uncharacterized membrane protein YqiK